MWVQVLPGPDSRTIVDERTLRLVRRWTTSEPDALFESSPVWYALVDYFRTCHSIRE
jgi:hypothetical protein